MFSNTQSAGGPFISIPINWNGSPEYIRHMIWGTVTTLPVRFRLSSGPGHTTIHTIYSMDQFVNFLHVTASVAPMIASCTGPPTLLSFTYNLNT